MIPENLGFCTLPRCPGDITASDSLLVLSSKAPDLSLNTTHMWFPYVPYQNVHLKMFCLPVVTFMEVLPNLACYIPLHTGYNGFLHRLFYALILARKLYNKSQLRQFLIPALKLHKGSKNNGTNLFLVDCFSGVLYGAMLAVKRLRVSSWEGG